MKLYNEIILSLLLNTDGDLVFYYYLDNYDCFFRNICRSRIAGTHICS